MKKSVVLIGIALCCLFFANCKKKYSEDDRKTVKSPEKRLKGAWDIEDYTFNGVSIVDTLNEKIAKPWDYSVKNYVLRYEQYPDDLPKYFQFGGYESYDAFDNTDYIKLKFFTNSTFNDPLGVDHNPFNELFVTPFRYDTNAVAYWRVTKLYKNDLHLTMSTDSGTYKLIFTRRPG